MSHELNPDSLAVCPFDSNHKIAAHKLQNHIIKCKKSHPEQARLLEHCPFNAVHLFMPKDKEEHLLTCIDRHRVLNKRPIETTCDVSVPIYVNHVNNPDDEDWDEEPDINCYFKPKLEMREANLSNEFPKTEPVQSKPNESLRKEIRPRIQETIIQEIRPSLLKSVESDDSMPRNLSIGRGAALRLHANKKLRSNFS